MDYFNQERGPVGSTAAGRVERNMLRGPWWKWSLWKADTSASENENDEGIPAYSCSLTLYLHRIHWALLIPYLD